MDVIPDKSEAMRGGKARRGLVLSLGLLLLGLLVAWGAGVFDGRVYESTVVLRVAVGEDGETGIPGLDVMESEARRLVGTETLELVEEEMGLAVRWEETEEEVVELLRGAVTAEVREGTALIEVSVRLAEASEARLVAMGLASAYRDLRRREEEERAAAAVEALDEQLREQEQRVEEKKRTMDDLREDLDGDQAVEAREDRKAGDFLALQEEEDAYEQILEEMGEKKTPDLWEYAASLDLAQNSVKLLWVQYLELGRERESLRSGGIGDAHPKVVSVDVQLSMLEGDLKAEVKKVRKSVEGHLETLRKKMILARDVWVAPRQQDLLKRHESPRYLEAVHRYRVEYEHLAALRMARAINQRRARLEDVPVEIVIGAQVVE